MLPTKATHRGHVWTWDFISDATVRGGALRMLTILDEHTRECHVLRPERTLRAADVLAWLETNHVERWFGTLRARVSRLIRKAYSFSKCAENHLDAIHFFITNYNLGIQDQATKR